MGRPSNTERRRRQIAEGLKKTMALKGYDGSSIADIAAAAGLTSGLVHYHFKSKLEILELVLDQLVTDHHDHLREAIASASGEVSQEVANFIDVHLAVGKRADSEAVACWIILGGEALRHDTIREQYGAAMESLTMELAQIVKRGIKEGIFHCSDVDAASCALMACIQGYFTLAATVRSLIPRGSAARSTKLMAQGLLAPTRPIDASALAPPRQRRVRRKKGS